MPTPAEKLKSNVSFINNFNYHAIIEWEKVYLNPDQYISPHFEIIKRIASSIDSIPIQDFPFNGFTSELDAYLEKFASYLKQTKQNTESKIPDKSALNNTRQLINNEISNFINNSNKIVAFSLIANSYYSNTINDLRLHSEITFTEIEQFRKRAEGDIKTINDLQRKAEIQVLATKVSDHSEIFKNQESGYRRTANKWLWGTIGSAFATILVAVCWQFVFPFNNTGELSKLLPQISTKVIVLTLLISALVWCSKLYKSNLNLAIIYKHKADSLATFEEFAKAATNDVTKDYVLQETTRAIFSVPVTGLINQDPLPIESGTKIFEMIKEMK